jgi:hypothetical protein
LPPEAPFALPPLASASATGDEGLRRNPSSSIEKLRREVWVGRVLVRVVGSVAEENGGGKKKGVVRECWKVKGLGSPKAP